MDFETLQMLKCAVIWLKSKQVLRREKLLILTKMPFPKLRLKKKQQYNVASKAMYVITVELLDNNQLECTLTAESTGKFFKSTVFNW